MRGGFILFGLLVIFCSVCMLLSCSEQTGVREAIESGTGVECLWRVDSEIHSQAVYLVHLESHSYVVCVDDGSIMYLMKVRDDLEAPSF